MPEIVFPTSTQPSANPTENGGRLINAYAETAPVGSRGTVILRRAPGLTLASLVGDGLARGAVTVGSVLYVVNDDTAYTITKAGAVYTVTALGGTVPGDGPVQMERNMRSPTAQILILHSAGMSKIESGAVADFSDSDLPAVNSIGYMDSYFLFSSADGRCFASAVNDLTVAGTDFTTAESSPDGLKRVVSMGRDLLLMGDSSIEFWGNTGNATGFPFSRGPVISVGLLSTRAVAGNEYGFTGPLHWVGNDRRVYELSGYSPVPISTPYIEGLLETVDPDDLEASVYVAKGHACFVLQSTAWTLVYSDGQWHERMSIGSSLWRAHFGVNAFNEWLTFDRTSTAMYRVDATAKREGTSQLVWEIRSTQTHRFPGRFRVNRASFDMVTGVGNDRGIAPIETDPMVSISWSDDGGRTFGNPRLLRLGSQGELTAIDIFNCGLTTRLGRQWKLQVSDPVEVSFMGGAMDSVEIFA